MSEQSLENMYTEKRREYIEEITARMSESGLEISYGKDFGVSVRVLGKGWGFASGKNEEEVVEKARRNAQIGKEEKKEIVPATISATIENSTEIPDIEEIKKEIKEIYEEIKAYRKSVFVKVWKVRREFENDYCEVVEEDFYFYGGATVYAKEGGRIEQYSERVGKRGVDWEGLKEKALEAQKFAYELLKAKRIKPGIYPLVFDSEITGLLSHEGVGHASEGDSILTKDSLFEGKLGEEIADEKLTIIDNPKIGFGGYEYDDEGHKSKKVEIIKNGVLKEYLTDEESGKLFGENGHGRAESYAYQPQVRMSNTYVAEGDAKDEELFEGEGVFLKGMRGGSVDTFTGEFIFTSAIAWKFKDGEFVEALKDVSVSGNFLEAIKNVELIGKNIELSPGFCGKGGQYVPVSDGGPKIKMKGKIS